MVVLMVRGTRAIPLGSNAHTRTIPRVGMLKTPINSTSSKTTIIIYLVYVQLLYEAKTTPINLASFNLLISSSS